MPVSTSDIADPVARARGPGAHRMGRRPDARPALDPRAPRRRAPARRHHGGGVPARHRRDGQPRAARSSPAAPRSTLCAANPLSTQDETAAALAEDFGAEVHARHGEDAEAYAAHVAACARRRPHVTLDDGADLVIVLHHARARVRERLHRRHRGDHHRPAARARARGRGAADVPGHRRQRGARRAHLQRPLRHRPVRARRDPARAPTSCSPGRPSSSSATAGPAAASPSAPAAPVPQVVVCEVDPVRALEARMEGFEVMPALEAAVRGDVFITVTGLPRRSCAASTSSA